MTTNKKLVVLYIYIHVYIVCIYIYIYLSIYLSIESIESIYLSISVCVCKSISTNWPASNCSQVVLHWSFGFQGFHCKVANTQCPMDISWLNNDRTGTSRALDWSRHQILSPLSAAKESPCNSANLVILVCQLATIASIQRMKHTDNSIDCVLPRGW